MRGGVDGAGVHVRVCDGMPETDREMGDDGIAQYANMKYHDISSTLLPAHILYI